MRRLPHNEATAWSRFDTERNAVEYTIGTYEEITPGIFHKLTGALTSKGLRILSASIATLAEGLVLDRFYVSDTDFAGVPPVDRMTEVCGALIAALKDKTNKPLTFRRIWQAPGAGDIPNSVAPPAEVRIDNSTAENFTILDIFAHDRMGLLYTITRTIFELGLSVHLSKIGTYLDQVLDVFYVTNAAGGKITDDAQLQAIRERLLEAISSP